MGSRELPSQKRSSRQAGNLARSGDRRGDLNESFHGTIVYTAHERLICVSV